MRRATRAGATVAFISPAFPTKSHRGKRRRLATGSLEHHSGAVPFLLYALGGVNGHDCTAARGQGYEGREQYR